MSQEIIREEFIGYVELKCQDVLTISNAIQSFLIDQNFPAENCVGFGFDRYSTMTGKEISVHTILNKKYTKSLFFYCSNHGINVVVNDIINTIVTIKDTVSFFRDTSARRNSISTLEKLCDTR